MGEQDAAAMIALEPAALNSPVSLFENIPVARLWPGGRCKEALKTKAIEHKRTEENVREGKRSQKDERECQRTLKSSGEQK